MLSFFLNLGDVVKMMNMIRTFLFLLMTTLHVSHLNAQGGLKICAEYSFNQFETAAMNQFVESFTGFWGQKFQPHISHLRVQNYRIQILVFRFIRFMVSLTAQALH